MRLSDHCWQHALVLLEIADEAPEFKDRAVALAQMWLTLAVLEDQTTVLAHRAGGESSTN
jgi:hypothetical protein